MTRLEAAQYLNISVSTLDRYRKQGRLRPGKARGKTRPVLVYSEQELQRFKEEALAGSVDPDPEEGQTRGASFTVGFRIDPHSHTLLKERALAANMTAGEYARDVLLRDLTSGEEKVRVFEMLEVIREGMTQSREEMERNVQLLRAGLTDAFYLLAERPSMLKKEDKLKVEKHLKACLMRKR